MKKKSKIFSIKYFLILVILITIIFLLFHPRYLFNNNEFFKTDYYRYLAIDHFSFLPDNPYYNVVCLISYKKSKQTYGVNSYYYNFETDALKQIEFPNYSINYELCGDFSNLYYDKEERTVETIFTINGADYYLNELYNQFNNFKAKSQKIFHYQLYDELQSKKIDIKNIRIFPLIMKEKNSRNIIITYREDGYEFSLNIKTIIELNSIPLNEIKDSELYLSLSEDIKKAIGISFSPEEIFEIKQFLLRNSYYKKTFFSIPDFIAEGFLGAKIVGKIDANNDGLKEYLIQVRGARFINSLLLCYDKLNYKIVWERTFIYGISNNLKIIDIDDDGIDEILFTTVAYCNEPAKVEVEIGLNKLEYLFLSEQKKVLLGFNSSSEKLEKNLIIYDLTKNEVSELDIKYNCLVHLDYVDEDIIAVDFYKNKLKKIVISRDFNLKKIQTKKVGNSLNYLPERVMIDNKKYCVLSSPFSILDDKLNFLYKGPYKVNWNTTFWKENEIYFKEKINNRNYLSKLTFSRNYKLNLYIIIIFLAEIMLLLIYFIIKQQVNIPIKSATNSYFVLYKILGKLYFWKLIGKLQQIYKLPKKISVEKEIPDRILKEISDESELIYQKNLFFFRLWVFEISSTDEFQIIQRISHDLKNQVLMTKLMTEQYEKDLKIKNKDFVENMTSSLKDISSSAQMLSNFSHINKLYKENVEIRSFIESIISQYVNHPLFDCICHSEKISQRHSTKNLCENDILNKKSKNPENFRDQDDIFVNIDKTLFQIAFKNIINNALEAITEKDYIKIEISETHENIIIEVKNPSAYSLEDCEKFYKIGFSTKEDGSGLGIPISKTIIEKHNGSLSINCKNSEFIVTVILSK